MLVKGTSSIYLSIFDYCCVMDSFLNVIIGLVLPGILFLVGIVFIHLNVGIFMSMLLIASSLVGVKQEFRKDWLSILMIVTSARSSINIRHLEKATVSTGKEGLLSEGNAAYNWSRYYQTLIWHDYHYSPIRYNPKTLIIEISLGKNIIVLLGGC